MIDLDGEIEGPITATRDTALWGTVSGDVVVKAGVRLELHGKVMGNLTIEKGAAVLVHGAVSGAVINDGAHVVVFGRAGSVEDVGGERTQIAPEASVGI